MARMTGLPRALRHVDLTRDAVVRTYALLGPIILAAVVVACGLACQPAPAQSPPQTGSPANLPPPYDSPEYNRCLPNFCEPPHQGLFVDRAIPISVACSDYTCEAKQYYKAIGAYDDNWNPTETGTFKRWKSTYGFSADPTKPADGEVQAIFYNNADLQLGRDVHCRSDSFETVACYVSNYGDPGGPPQSAIRLAASNQIRRQTVAMVYGFDKAIEPSTATQPYRVQFYAFSDVLNGDVNDGELLPSVPLDNEGAKAMPGLCLACHGGSYEAGTTHKVQNASFLPFDAPTYIFSMDEPFQHAVIPNRLEFMQRGAIRKLNKMVKAATYVRPTISQLIDGWYQWCGGVDAEGCYIDEVNHPFYPNQLPCPTERDKQSDVSCGWPATAQSFYQRVPRLYCRTCHVALADRFNVNSFTDWKNKAAAPYLIQGAVLTKPTPPHLHMMPFAEVPYKAFWWDFQAKWALEKFLRAPSP